MPTRLLASSRPILLFLLLLPAVSLLPSLCEAQELQRRVFSIGGPFDESYRARDKLVILKDASVNNGAIQLTPDSRNNVSFLINKSGRVLYPTPFKIWEERAPVAPSSNGTASARKKRVISFNTSFDFNVFRDANQTAGEGIAFIIVPHANGVPPGSEGGYLGLTNATIDGDAANQLVAVEFDTVKQPYDPDDNHVGIDVNSVVSVANRSLSELNITIAPEVTTQYTAWIDYGGEAARIEVFVDFRGKPKPRTPALSARLDLGEHLAPVSYFGFAGSTGKTLYELNCILSWNMSAEVFPGDDKSEVGGWILKVGLPVLAVVVLSSAAVFFYCLHRAKAKRDRRLAGTLKSLPGMPREFTYKELKKATGNFDGKNNRLGQGGFGVVFRGVVPGEGTQVAVKLFSRDQSMQGDFLAELTIINRLRHKHLVRLLGWCHKNGKLLLVYEYMPNGSLDTHLYDAPPGEILSWDRRCKILAGVASALNYLHNEYEQKVVHRDLKASNILLDADFNARLGDFGLARAIDNERTSFAEVELDGVPGTMGYVAPECFHTGKATRESDVFGFGAVILEVVCGRRPRCDLDGFRFLVDWVWKLYREGRLLEALDPQLDGDFVAAGAERLLLLGLACSHPIPGDRPKTQEVVQIISGTVAPPRVPPFRPAFVWPSVVLDVDDDGATTTTAASSTAGWTPHFNSKDSLDAVVL